MSDQTTYADIVNAISSRASEAGRMQLDWLDGLTTENSGPEAAPVSHSPLPESKRGLMTQGTSGLSGSISSRSEILQSSLESRLRARLNGSDLCEVIWKKWATPWGQCLSRPRARVRTTYGTGIGSWPTPRANEGTGAKTPPGRMGGPSLKALVSSWPTPTTRDHKDGKYCPNVPVNGLLGRMVWPTPTATHRVRSEETLAKCAAFRKKNANQNTVPLYLAEVATNSTGPSEQTAKPGALNPEFVCWLMGFPIEWLSCAPSGTQSTRGRHHSS